MTFDPETHAEALHLMETEIVAWLTTVTPGGVPQSSVICFVWDGETILTYSESSDPTSPHYTDQTKLYAEKGWNSLPFCGDDVAKAAESTATWAVPGT